MVPLYVGQFQTRSCCFIERPDQRASQHPVLISVFINLIICSVAAVLATDQSLWCAISKRTGQIAHLCLKRMVAEREDPELFSARGPEFAS